MLILEQRKRRSGPKPPLVINHQHPLAQGLINASPYWHPRAEGFSSNMLAPRKRLDVSGGATPQFVSAGESGGYNVLSTNNAIYNAVPADKRKILDASGVSFAALSYVHAVPHDTVCAPLRSCRASFRVVRDALLHSSVRDRKSFLYH